MDAALHYAGLVHERVSIRDCGAADQAHAPKAVPNLRLLASLNQALATLRSALSMLPEAGVSARRLPAAPRPGADAVAVHAVAPPPPAPD